MVRPPRAQCSDGLLQKREYLPLRRLAKGLRLDTKKWSLAQEFGHAEAPALFDALNNFCQLYPDLTTSLTFLGAM